jgi:hypothetical protein
MQDRALRHQRETDERRVVEVGVEDPEIGLVRLRPDVLDE